MGAHVVARVETAPPPNIMIKTQKKLGGDTFLVRSARNCARVNSVRQSIFLSNLDYLVANVAETLFCEDRIC